jgi:hypothetical protein
MFLNFVKVAPDRFADDGMSYQERMRREAAKLEQKHRLGRLIEKIIIGAIKWTFFAGVFAIVGLIIFLAVGAMKYPHG